MKINCVRYAIITKEKPFEFVMDDNNQTENIEEAMLNDLEDTCNKIIKTFPRPDEYEIMKVEVTYKF
jgi:hypothetical protein